MLHLYKSRVHFKIKESGPGLRCSQCMSMSSDDHFKHGEVFGSIMISDEHGLRPFGWNVSRSHGPGLVTLFNHNHHCREKIQNHGRLKIGNPKSGRSIPFASSMRMVMSLYATSQDEDDIFEICSCDNIYEPLDFSKFLKSHSQVKRGSLLGEGADGETRMYYILLKDAVDVFINAELVGISREKVCGEIYAYYENMDCGDPLVDSLYKASLLEFTDNSGDFEGGHLVLTRSVLVVPSNGALVIEARITNLDSRVHILRGKYVFESHQDGIFHGEIEGTGCHLKLQVSWSED